MILLENDMLIFFLRSAQKLSCVLSACSHASSFTEAYTKSLLWTIYPVWYNAHVRGNN